MIVNKKTDINRRSIPALRLKSESKDIIKTIDITKQDTKRKLDDICNDAYKKYLNKTTDEYVKLLVIANQYWSETKYSGTVASIIIKWDDFFKKNKVSKDMETIMRSATIPIYHPKIFYNALIEARSRNNDELYKALMKEFDKKFPDEFAEIMAETLKINGASEHPYFYIQYRSRKVVQDFFRDGGLTDISKVRGFRNELPLKNIEGYIKYAYDDYRCKFLYFSFKDLYNELGDDKAF